MTLRVELPWPPTSNHLRMPVRMGRATRLITSPVARAYYAAGQEALKGQVSAPLTGRLGVRLELCPPTRRPFDIDNRTKSVLDLLQKAGVLLDDAQIDELTILRRDVAEGGRVIATLWPLEAA